MSVFIGSLDSSLGDVKIYNYLNRELKPTEKCSKKVLHNISENAVN